jgi:hypothetical protein
MTACTGGSGTTSGYCAAFDDRPATGIALRFFLRAAVVALRDEHRVEMCGCGNSVPLSLRHIVIGVTAA